MNINTNQYLNIITGKSPIQKTKKGGEVSSVTDSDSNNSNTYTSYPQKKRAKINDHSEIFYIPELEDEFVRNKYAYQEDTFVDLERLMFQTNIGLSLKPYYDILKSKNAISIGYDSRSISGVIEFDIIDNAKIFLQYNETIVSMAGTLIHELTHYKDFKDIKDNPNRLTYQTTFDFEISAFANKYLFFKEIGYLDKDEYLLLSDLAQNLLKGSYQYHNSSNHSLEAKRYMSELFYYVGYDYNEQKESVV